MDQTQLVVALLPPLATLATVIVGFLYNNARITDLRTDMNARFGDMNTRMSDMQTEVKDMVRVQATAHSSDLRRVEDMLLGKFAELDNRLSRIESHLNLH